jgi:alpha-mannosidase
VVAEGYRLNLPVRAQLGGSGTGAGAPVVTVDDDAVVVEAVKLADDGSGDVVVRCYESHGGRARATIVPGFEALGAVSTDAHERVGDPAPAVAVSWDGRAAGVELRAFQIATIRFTRS